MAMNMKRMRGRNHRGGGGGGGGGPVRHQSGNVPLNRNHVFDSSGPDLRVRGTAQQLFEKYLQLGRDATSGGDRVMAESYFQHAEHYFRILNAMNQAARSSNGGQPHQPAATASGSSPTAARAQLGPVGAARRAGRRARRRPSAARRRTRDIPITAAPPES